MLAVWTTRHLLQFLPEPALPEVPGQCAPPLATSAPRRTAADALCTCGLHSTARTGGPGISEQEGCLRAAVSTERRDLDEVRTRSAPARRRDRVLQRATHLEPETGASPTCTLCSSRRGSRT